MPATINETDRLARFADHVAQRGLPTLEPLLPVLLSLKGKPFTLENHQPFGPWFRTDLPYKRVVKAGRQVAKSTNQAADGIVFSNAVPNTTILFVTPLFEQVRRFSANYVRPFIDESPVKALFCDSTTENSVLQRSFLNRSRLVFSYAFLNADRTRGINADRLKIDELQDMDVEHIPVISETMSHSEWEIMDLSGTPKSLDNAVEVHFQQSSQAEWFVKCDACGHWNVPSVEFDLLKMIGPWREDIGPARPGTVCARCGRPINPRAGYWVHRHPERRHTFAGYHIPQLIMPLHFASARKWAELLAKQQNLAPHLFFNEVLGESYDAGSRLVTVTDIENAACLPWTNDPRAAVPGPEVMARLRHYTALALGVDWGGGGKKGVSYTTLSLAGLRGNDGSIDVLWGRRLLTPHDHILEAQQVMQVVQAVDPAIIAHDYTGAGALRETILVQTSPTVLSRLMPVYYVRAATHNLVNYVPETPTHPRKHWQVDRTRSLLLLAGAIRLGLVRFFQNDYESEENPGLLRDFLALIDEKIETGLAAGTYVIRKQEGRSDDFAFATNQACVALWHAQQAWPDLANRIPQPTPMQLAAMMGPDAGLTATELDTQFPG